MNHQEVEVFLALVRAGLWEEVNENLNDNLFSGLDWGEVQKLAEEQSVIGLMAAGIEKIAVYSIPFTEKLTLLGKCQLIEQRNEAMNDFIAKLFTRLNKEGIAPLLMKGQGVAQCYERPLWRELGDVDLLFNENDYEKTKVILIPMASTVEKEGVGSKHLGMYIDDWLVELHGSLRCGIPSGINKMLDEIQWDIFYGGKVRTWTNGDTQIFLPSADNDAIYVFTHFLNHFYKGGVGLRQLCDWCRLLWKYKDEIDLAKLKMRLRQMQLVTEWKAFAAFAVEKLGMPVGAMPLYDSDEKWQRKANKIKNFILESGNFGKNRDMSYYEKYPYLIRKTISIKRRIGDLFNHARIFPLGAVRFFPSIMFNGFIAFSRGE